MNRPQSRGRMLTRVLAASIALVVGVSLTGCMPWMLPQGKSGSVSTPAAEKVSPDLQKYYSQRLTWTTCGKFQCTKVTAPLDWAKPAGDTIKLALIRQQAKGTKLGSLLVNPGGPGGSGVDFIKNSVNYATDATLQSSYDIVGFDPRGVGSSTAVTCYDASQMDHYLYDIAPGTPGSAQWIAAQTTTAKNFGQACKKNTGSLLGEVDTISAAKDLDLLRATLGDKKLNYLGYSYGTYLGATYANLFPDKTGRLVLDGALDPEASNFEVTKVQSEGFESALRAYLKDCLANNKKCPFSGSVDSGMSTISKLLASVQTTPIRNSDGRELGANTLLTAIIYPLYDATAWNYLSDMFRSVMNGDARYAFQLADGYNGRDSSTGKYDDNSTEAFVAINCLDYTYNDDPAVMRQQAAEITAAAPTIGPYMSYGDIGCGNWPYTSHVKRGPIHAKGAAPIIVVGTTNDPATPYVWAQNLSKELESGHLVTYHGEGHTAYNKSNSCVNNAVDDYFVKGTVPIADPMC